LYTSSRQIKKKKKKNPVHCDSYHALGANAFMPDSVLRLSRGVAAAWVVLMNKERVVFLAETRTPALQQPMLGW
jgi:hypothetical protein